MRAGRDNQAKNMEANLNENERAALTILRTETGSLNPIGGSTLARRTKVKSISGIIHSLRLRKFPICQKGKRYFYAHTDDDLAHFITQIERKISVMGSELTGLKASYFNVNSFERSFGQNGEVEEFVTKPVRRGDNVVYERFKLDGAGQPIIPEGTPLI